MHISRVAKNHGCRNADDIFRLAISLGGKKVERDGWVRLPHLCGGKLPGDSVGDGGLKINIYSGGVVCHYGCSKEDAENAVYNADVVVDTQRVYEPEPEQKKQEKAHYRTTPFDVLDQEDAQLYLLNVDIGHEASTKYRRSTDGLIGRHVRYYAGGKTKKRTPGITGSGWEPRIWEPTDRIRECLVVCEGEKDAATACVNGLTAASYAGGAGRAGSTEWSGLIEYAEKHGLEIIQCPDTGDAGTKAKDQLGRDHGWPVADLTGIPDGDCPMDMPDWLARIDARKPWAPEQNDDSANPGESAGKEEPHSFDGTETGKNGDPCFNAKDSGGSRFSDDEDKTGGFDDGTHEEETPSSDGTPDPDEETPVVPRNTIPAPEVFPCDDWGWAYTEHDMHDGDKARILERCHECAGCNATRREERAWRYERWRVHDVQTTVRIPGWKNIEDLVRFRGLDIHKKRTPSGKRVSSILTEAHRTYALVFVYDGEMDEDQQNRVIQHAAKDRYGMEATITVGPLTQGQFKGLVSDEASIESEDRKYNCLSLRCWTQTEDLADYSMGAGRPESIPLCDEPMTKSSIPVQHQVVLDLYKRPQAEGDPVWTAKLEIVASYFARGWMVQCEHLAAGVVRSDVRTLGDWRGPIGLIQNAGRYIEGKRPWRDAYGWVLLLAGLGEHIPEDRRYHFDQDRFFREGMHAHHCGGRLDEEWTKDIEPAPPSDMEEKPHAEEQEKPHGWRRPQWERPRPKRREPDFSDMDFEEPPDLEDIHSGWTPFEDEYKMAA